jgi:hypothetical protein
MRPGRVGTLSLTRPPAGLFGGETPAGCETILSERHALEGTLLVRRVIDKRLDQRLQGKIVDVNGVLDIYPGLTQGVKLPRSGPLSAP